MAAAAVIRPLLAPIWRTETAEEEERKKKKRKKRKKKVGLVKRLKKKGGEIISICSFPIFMI